MAIKANFGRTSPVVLAGDNCHYYIIFVKTIGKST